MRNSGVPETFKSLSVWLVSLWLLLEIGGALSGAYAGQRSDHPADEVAIRVDPAVELFSTIHRLAGTGQYDEMLLPEYDRRVEEYFGRFRDHRAVKLAAEMRETHHINGNAPMALACYLSAPPALKERAPLLPPPDDMDPRWTAEAIPMALEAAREFARDTDFMTFFNSQKDFHEKSLENLRKTLEGADLVPWFRNFFGYLPDNYVMLIGMLNGSCNYGQSVTLPDGSREFISILGARGPDEEGAPQFSERWSVSVTVHEFCHSYVNPLVDRNRSLLKEPGEAIFPHVSEKMKESGYNFWYVMMYEYLVRACTTRYVANRMGPGQVITQIVMDTRAGFPGMQKLNTLMEEYETNRDRYPDMESFMPRVAEFFEEFAATFQ